MNDVGNKLAGWLRRATEKPAEGSYTLTMEISSEGAALENGAIQFFRDRRDQAGEVLAYEEGAQRIRLSVKGQGAPGFATGRARSREASKPVHQPRPFARRLIARNALILALAAAFLLFARFMPDQAARLNNDILSPFRDLASVTSPDVP